MKTDVNKIIFEYGHWHLPAKLSALLSSCRYDRPTRYPVYSLEDICVRKDSLGSTDGQRIIEVTMQHEIEPGVYYCTLDGWLLSDPKGKFPNYEKVLPAPDELELLVEAAGDKGLLFTVLSHLIRTKCLIDIDLLYGPGKILEQMERSVIRVYVYPQLPEMNPFMLVGQCEFGAIRYVQLPVT